MATTPDEPAYWVDEIPTIEIKGGVCMVAVQTGGHTIELRFTPAILVGTMREAHKAIAAFNAEEGADVVPIKRPKRLRAAH
jgi:hypothetical protein